MAQKQTKLMNFWFQEMIKEADIDNDGKISFEEFKTVMKT